MVSSRSRDFLTRFLDDGGKVILVSGRMPASCKKLEERLGSPLDAICCNGAAIISGGKLIKDETFEAQPVKNMIEEINREMEIPIVMLFTRNRGVVSQSHSLTRFVRFGFSFYTFFQFNYREEMLRDDKAYYEELEKGEIYKVMLYFGATKKKIARAEEAAKLLALRYPQFCFAWSKQVVEITPKGCTKSQGLSFYLDYNKIDHDNVLVIGDSGNDISMFDDFPDNSFCMEHAPESVRSHAKHTIHRFGDLQEYVYPSAETDLAEKQKK